MCVCVSVCFGGGERGLRTMRNGSRKGGWVFFFFLNDEKIVALSRRK